MAGDDPWAAWLRERRHGGDEDLREQVLGKLRPIRNLVLEHARIAEGDTVLDVGCGDGLIGFGALARVGERGRVVFSDVSQELLDTCREIAAGDARCQFLLGSATELPLPDGSVDVVTARSVLIYVEDKARAFRELHRVLRPGGRLSVFEPVNDYAFPEPEGWFHFWDVGPVAGLAERVKAHVRAAARDGTLGGFDERDLLRWAEEAGFREVHLEYRADVAPTDPFPHYEALERSSSNPLAPTLGEAIDAALGPGEAARFRAHLRAAVEEGRGVERQAVAYVWAARGP